MIADLKCIFGQLFKIKHNIIKTVLSKVGQHMKASWKH
jgi:hypothetical protein